MIIKLTRFNPSYYNYLLGDGSDNGISSRHIQRRRGQEEVDVGRRTYSDVGGIYTGQQEVSPCCNRTTRSISVLYTPHSSIDRRSGRSLGDTLHFLHKIFPNCHSTSIECHVEAGLSPRSSPTQHDTIIRHPARIPPNPSRYISCFFMSSTYAWYLAIPWFTPPGQESLKPLLFGSCIYGLAAGCYMSVDYALALDCLPDKSTKGSSEALGLWGRVDGSWEV